MDSNKGLVEQIKEANVTYYNELDLEKIEDILIEYNLNIKDRNNYTLFAGGRATNAFAIEVTKEYETNILTSIAPKFVASILSDLIDIKSFPIPGVTAFLKNIEI